MSEITIIQRTTNQFTFQVHESNPPELGYQTRTFPITREIIPDLPNLDVESCRLSDHYIRTEIFFLPAFSCCIAFRLRRRKEQHEDCERYEEPYLVSNQPGNILPHCGGSQQLAYGILKYVLFHQQKPIRTKRTYHRRNC